MLPELRSTGHEHCSRTEPYPGTSPDRFRCLAYYFPAESPPHRTPRPSFDTYHLRPHGSSRRDRSPQSDGYRLYIRKGCPTGTFTYAFGGGTGAGARARSQRVERHGARSCCTGWNGVRRHPLPHRGWGRRADSANSMAVAAAGSHHRPHSGVGRTGAASRAHRSRRLSRAGRGQRSGWGWQDGSRSDLAARAEPSLSRWPTLRRPGRTVSKRTGSSRRGGWPFSTYPGRIGQADAFGPC
ncbi:Leucine Rich Repeat family protein, expressed [Streptomyces hygroscopicus]|nr:Leucine Rich Repeat family protein, expressed [Streptomyces hygroscopicus]